jgi:tetratricopeptide (TPR) repeat protein
MRKLVGLVASALALALPSAAQAEWLEASSANFVVYADDSERDIRRFSEQLELYHQAMEVVTGLDLPEPSPSNRLTVFVVKNQREVQKLYGDGSRYLGGFYLPRAGGSLAIVPRVELRKNEPDQSMIVLLHEYAHHFLVSNSGLPTPRWVGEGAAEFFASTEFPTSGGIKIGMPAHHRAAELFYAKDVKVEQLLDPASYADGAKNGFDAFYGKSWLLYHYLTFGKTRGGQLKQYLMLMGQGKSSTEAGVEAFGDLKALERELDKYAREKILAAVFAPEGLPIGPINVRALSAGEAAVLPVRIRSRRGVTREQALELLPEAREIAAAHPRDAAVLAALAEAEYDAGNDAEAIAAADAALVLDPKQVNAYIQKGYALFRRAAEADDREAAYKAAVEPFLALNKLENDHPLPLIYYFRSFAERGMRPPEQAVHGLERAAELAPFDLGLRFDLATHQVQAGDLAQARYHLRPIAFNPHGGEMAEAARRVIELIDAGTTAEPQELLAPLQPAAASGG